MCCNTLVILIDAHNNVTTEMFWCAPCYVGLPHACSCFYSTASSQPVNWTDLSNRPSYTTRSLVTHVSVVLIGCGETRAVSARLVLNTRIPVWLFTLESANWSSVQFSSVHVLSTNLQRMQRIAAARKAARRPVSSRSRLDSLGYINQLRCTADGVNEKRKQTNLTRSRSLPLRSDRCANRHAPTEYIEPGSRRRASHMAREQAYLSYAFSHDKKRAINAVLQPTCQKVDSKSLVLNPSKWVHSIALLLHI